MLNGGHPGFVEPVNLDTKAPHAETLAIHEKINHQWPDAPADLEPIFWHQEWHLKSQSPHIVLRLIKYRHYEPVGWNWMLVANKHIVRQNHLKCSFVQPYNCITVFVDLSSNNQNYRPWMPS